LSAGEEQYITGVLETVNKEMERMWNVDERLKLVVTSSYWRNWENHQNPQRE